MKKLFNNFKENISGVDRDNKDDGLQILELLLIIALIVAAVFLFQRFLLPFLQRLINRTEDEIDNNIALGDVSFFN